MDKPTIEREKKVKWFDFHGEELPILPPEYLSRKYKNKKPNKS